MNNRQLNDNKLGQAGRIFHAIKKYEDTHPTSKFEFRAPSNISGQIYSRLKPESRKSFTQPRQKKDLFLVSKQEISTKELALPKQRGSVEELIYDDWKDNEYRVIESSQHGLPQLQNNCFINSFFNFIVSIPELLFVLELVSRKGMDLASDIMDFFDTTDLKLKQVLAMRIASYLKRTVGKDEPIGSTGDSSEMILSLLQNLNSFIKSQKIVIGIIEECKVKAHSTFIDIFPELSGFVEYMEGLSGYGDMHYLFYPIYDFYRSCSACEDSNVFFGWSSIDVITEFNYNNCACGSSIVDSKSVRYYSPYTIVSHAQSSLLGAEVKAFGYEAISNIYYGVGHYISTRRRAGKWTLLDAAKETVIESVDYNHSRFDNNLTLYKCRV